MISPTDRQSISPIVRATGPLAVLDTTDTTTEVEFRLGQIRMANTFHDFVKGHDYLAKITHKLDATHVIMHVNGHHIQMSFDQNFPLGQHLQLRFMGSNPAPSFMLLNTMPIMDGDAQTQVSTTGQWVSQLLSAGNSPIQAIKLDAPAPITQAPLNQPHLVAQHIQQTVSTSGLFYESHLAAFTKGTVSIASILQEPQNAMPQHNNALVLQQLNVLETNKFEWQGQVWQNQLMQFSIEKLPRFLPVNNTAHEHSPATPNANAFESNLHLDLPKMGSVNAKLRLENGQLRIQLTTQNQHALASLREEKHALIQAFENTSQQLIALSIEPEHASR